MNRVGVGTGVYALGAPRQIEFGLRLTFSGRPVGVNVSRKQVEVTIRQVRIFPVLYSVRNEPSLRRSKGSFI